MEKILIWSWHIAFSFKYVHVSMKELNAFSLKHVHIATKKPVHTQMLLILSALEVFGSLDVYTN